MFRQSAPAHEAVNFSCDMEQSIRLSICSSCGDGPIGSARGPCSSLSPEHWCRACWNEWSVMWIFKSDVANRRLSLA